MKHKNIILTLAVAMTYMSLSYAPDIKASSIEENDLINRSVTDAGAALQGKFSGLLVLNQSGAPGERAKLNIRGFTTSSGNGNPLYIVDGLKVENIQHLDPSMIETVEVLKDGAATALYGIHGGNGVIRITTRKGSGKFKISYDLKIISSSQGKKADLLDAKEWISHMKEISGQDIGQLIEQYGHDGTDTDWQDVVYRNGFAHQHGVSLQGGNDKGSFYAAVNYLDNDGMVVGNSDTHQRISARLNGRYNVTEWLELGINASYTDQDITFLAQQKKMFTLFSSVLTMDPLTRPYLSDDGEFMPDRILAQAAGTYIPKDSDNDRYYSPSAFDNSNVNPLLFKDITKMNARQDDIHGVIYAVISPLKGFSFTARAGYINERQDRNTQASPYYYTSALNSNQYLYSASERRNTGYQIDAIAAYGLEKGRHELDISAGLSFNKIQKMFRDDSVYSMTGPVSHDDLTFSDLGDDISTEYSDMGVFAGVGYSYDRRYMIHAGIRADRYRNHSFIGSENPMQSFPAVSAGWNISNERFFRNSIPQKIISDLSLHVSWGKGGSTSDMEAFHNGFVSGLYQISGQFAFGAGMRLADGRLKMDAEWYTRKTSGLPAVIKVLPSYYSSVMNKGLDLDMTWSERYGDFTYRISGNLSTLKNEVIEFTHSDTIDLITTGSNRYNEVSTAYEPGKPMWYFYGYKGPVDIQDIYTGQIEKGFIGKGIPSLYYGITLNLSYKGFDFTTYGSGVSGNEIANCVYGRTRTFTNVIRDLANKKNWTGTGLEFESDAFVFDGSWFRIKQMQLGYTIPDKITRRIFIQKARLYISLDDWITFSSYPGGDPETATTGSRLSDLGYKEVPGMTSYDGKGQLMGADYGSYPISKKILFGLSIQF